MRNYRSWLAVQRPSKEKQRIQVFLVIIFTLFTFLFRVTMELHVKYEKALESDKHLRFCDIKEDLKNSMRLWLDAHAWQFAVFSNKVR